MAFVPTMETAPHRPRRGQTQPSGLPLSALGEQLTSIHKLDLQFRALLYPQPLQILGKPQAPEPIEIALIRSNVSLDQEVTGRWCVPCARSGLPAGVAEKQRLERLLCETPAGLDTHFQMSAPYLRRPACQLVKPGWGAGCGVPEEAELTASSRLSWGPRFPGL